MRMLGNLLNGMTSLARRLTNDDAANPRATLLNGHTGTSDEVGLGSRRPVIVRRAEAGSFSDVESRSQRVGRF